MILILALFVLGILVGRILHKREKLIRSVDYLSLISVAVLLFLLGVSIGIEPAVMKELPKVGGLSVFIAFCVIMGSVSLSLLTYHLFFKKHEK